jgi:hypothetical protein
MINFLVEPFQSDVGYIVIDGLFIVLSILYFQYLSLVGSIAHAGDPAIHTVRYAETDHMSLRDDLAAGGWFYLVPDILKKNVNSYFILMSC